MAQIIKHRRGSISALKDVTANVGELVMATGSIGDFNGPVVFVGDAAVAGGYKPISKIYQGTSAPSISVGSHGSTMDGLPFYSTGNQTLYILDKSGNSAIDLTGNIEGNLISGVTINNLTGTTVNLSNGGGTALTITGDIIQTGSFYTSGDIVLRGNINIGDNLTGDTITLNSEISSSLIPDVHNAFDLGSPSKNWRNLHVSGTAYIDTLNLGTITLNSLSLPGDLTVSGTTTLSGSVLVEDLTEKRLVVAGVDGLLTDYSGLTFDNGNLNLSGALEVTNIQGTGSLYLKADKNDSRHFEIYNTSVTDTHIKSNGGLSFFGDDTNFLKIDDSEQTATIVGVNGVIVSSSLQVTGSIYNNQLTDNRVLVAGTDGLIGDSQYFTYDENTLRVGAFEVDVISGDTRMSGSLLVTSTSELRGAVGMNSTLDVTGSAQFKSTIDVDGEATLSSATVEDLTQDRIVTVGVGGSLIDSSGFTYNGTVFKIGDGQFEVDTNDGDIRTSGSLTVEGGQTINGDVTVNGVLTVTGNTQLQANLYVSGNLEVLGSATNLTIQSQTVEIDDNIIRMNAYSPFLRYAGFEVIDSGSVGVSASFVWDSLNDYWMFVSASGESSKLIGTTAGTYGSETSLTSGTFPIATGQNTIGDSLLTYSGTTLSLNTNKFTVDSSTGDALVSGNFTLSYSGGTDNGSKTSAIMFRNSSNVVGFVSTTETTDVLDGLLGYKNANGGLVFSTVIDGGTY
jgi:cytoskeletal protein CcmA (bactofilin family)